MNVKTAKTLLQREISDVLPKSWVDVFFNILSIIAHNSFVSFVHVERFVVAALSHSLVLKEIQHVKVKCQNKGENAGKIYLTIEIFLKMKNEQLWKLSKSVHVKKRNSGMRD